MKIRVDKTELQKGIQAVGNVITPKNVLPILSNILFETQKNKVRLTTTDLDMGVSIILDAEILEPGAITIPTKRLSDIIKELPSGPVVINTRKNNVVDIQLDNCEFKLMGLPKEEFPKLPEIKEKESLVLTQDALKNMLQLTAFAVSHEETRYVLNGLLFEVKKSGEGESLVRFVGTDGRRLALVEKKMPLKAHKDAKVIIPYKTVQELLRNLKDEGDVSLIISQNQVFFEMDGAVIISRLIEGDFPDYQRVIPQASALKVRLNKDDFILVLRRANLLTTPDFQAVKFELFKNKLVVSKATPDVGEFKEEIPLEYGGKEFVIGFNPNYFLDVLRYWREPEFSLEFYDGEKPGVVRSPEYVYIVQPMRLS
ncbi:MAG: DNA polymerase III subunit beta [Candidatus Omnitrophota bacterium]|jgi:DNA polymerase-3 subunit beta|nr:DNA polymerase III subunit beta [Candidatus Omnitrophota bacterium]MDD5538885.1 DNA polymerase III subunit beta [Candidatus Omnitrophota bacterium]